MFYENKIGQYKLISSAITQATKCDSFWHAKMVYTGEIWWMLKIIYNTWHLKRSSCVVLKDVPIFVKIQLDTSSSVPTWVEHSKAPTATAAHYSCFLLSRF